MTIRSVVELYDNLIRNRQTVICEKIRDLSKIDLDDVFSLIVAVDSDGGIGTLPDDSVKCPGYDLGRFAMRVPLMEIRSSGAIPLAAYDMLTVPMGTYAEEIIRGIRTELVEAGLGDAFPLSGSTEDNVPTSMTGIGTTIIGLVHRSDFRPGSSKPGDVIICIGFPKSAPADTVLLSDPEIVHQQDLTSLLQIKGVHDILPVGSHGIGFESLQLARQSNLKCELNPNCPLDIDKSAGPSTCLLASCTTDGLKEIGKIIKTPVNIVGKLTAVK